MKKKWQVLLICMLLYTFSAEMYRKYRHTKKAIHRNWMRYGTYSFKNQGDLLTPFEKKGKKEFVIVIASYNNENYCEKNLLSVLDQNYDDYRVIYINDCSTDKTLQKVKDFVAYKGVGDRITIIENERREGKMKNLFNAYHSCRNDEIIVCLDGDDFLSHNRVLEDLNVRYQNPSVWLTYGSAIMMPQAKVLRSESFADCVKDTRSMRLYSFGMHMLRTFYAGLFKQLKLTDFLFQGEFLHSADDIQIMLSMFEMAPKHCLALDDIHYIINDENPSRTLRTFAGQEEYIGQWVRNLKKKPKLAETFDPRSPNLDVTKPVDAVLLSNSNPLALEKKIELLVQEQKQIGSISVFYDVAQKEHFELYKKLEARFSSVQWYDVNKCSMLKVLDTFSGQYLLFEHNTNLNISDIKFSEVGALLEKTKARAIVQDVARYKSNSIAAIHEGFKVLNSLSSSFCQKYNGYLIAKRHDLIQSMEQGSSTGMSFIVSEFLHRYDQDLFLCKKND